METSEISAVHGVGEQKTKGGKYTQEAGIDITYGEKTWRPVQTVIDLIQNHMDAHTTIYEKSLLKTLGIKKYNSKDPSQQTMVALLNTIKYATDPADVHFCL